MKEPSVLDYFKAILTPWKGPPPEIPAAEPVSAETATPGVAEGITAPVSGEPVLSISAQSEQPTIIIVAPQAPVTWPVAMLLSLILALAAQFALEPAVHRVAVGVILYLLAAAALVWAVLRREWAITPLPESRFQAEGMTVRVVPLLIGVLLALLAFLTFGGGRFNAGNVTFWVVALACLLWAFWIGKVETGSQLQRLWNFLSARQFHVTITRQALLVLAVVGIVVFFRAYRLADVPPEMVSDHAEKLLDVNDVLNGQWNIFFPRNTGREAFQFYLTVAVIDLFHTGLTFLSLKIGTLLCGLFMLIYMYLLGVEIGNRRVGLLAVLFTGIAYWPNVITRVALRFTLYPMFVAPLLYYLIRGLRTSRRNDFILAGIFLGIGLQGYSPYRIVPLLVIVAIVLYVLHRQALGARRQAVTGLFIVGVFSLVVFLPLLRYAVSNPQMFSYRTLTRVGTLEKPLDAPVAVIFLKNLWNALRMFGWDNGEVWVVSIPQRPALCVVSAALFHLGVLLVLLRYLRRRYWQDVLLLLSIPILLLPSILSLAFPNENPILNRTAGAIVPVFLIVALALDGLLRSLQNALGAPNGARLAWVLGIVLFATAALQDYTLVFDEYQNQYLQSAWNTSEMGKVIREFSEMIGTPDSAWVVAYPYWVDTRLVGMNAGFPTKDYAIWPEHFADTQGDANPKLFLLKPDDTQDVQLLQKMYPNGSLSTYLSRVESKNFLMFFVPPQTEQLPEQKPSP